MTTITEGLRNGEFIVSEAKGHRSREQIVLLAGLLAAGTVLGKTATSTATAAAVVGAGNGAMSAVTTTPDALQGVYTVKITKAAANAGDFEVLDPRNEVAGLGTVGVAYATGGLSFTLADGATDFAVGDTIKITVGSLVTRYAQLAPTATDGTQYAAGVLLNAAGAPAATAPGVAFVRDCEVNGNIIVWPAGITVAQKALAIAQLEARRVIVRS